MEPQMLLRDAAVEPTREVLRSVLGTERYAVYADLLKIITDEFALSYEWRYYKDGRAWLFKAVGRKKTVFWLSVWEGSVKTSFFFTEKTRSGVYDLPVGEPVKEEFKKAAPTGKLVPLILDLRRPDQLDDFREMVKYKSSLK